MNHSQDNQPRLSSMHALGRDVEKTLLPLLDSRSDFHHLAILISATFLLQLSRANFLKLKRA
jgi:hypothetical protein